MDLASILGLALAPACIIGGFLFEGGHVSAVMQPTAFVIVIGGTIGAVFISFPMPFIKAALVGAKNVIFPPKTDLAKLVADIVGYAQKARREGVVSLEADANGTKDKFLGKALGMAVDGTESRIIRDALEIQITHLEEEGEMACKVFEAAGALAPTFGIIGAVLGLIHVMENLADPAKLGAGIAVAFVATVYGLMFANILMLPIGGKLKIRHLSDMVHYELILTGVVAIVDGENPRIIEQKLNGFVADHGHGAAASTVSKEAA